MTDRDQVAREVLTELANWNMARVETLKDALRFRDERYPAPAATVTVTVEGSTYTREVDGWSVVRSDGSKIMWCGPLSDGASMLDRIAADARALAERDKRIREFEAYKALADELGTATTDMMRHLADGRTFDAPGRAHAREYAPNALDRYDAVARRIAELERELESATERERARWVREQEMDRERQEAICERDEARRALEAAQSAGNAPPSHQTPMNAALGHLAATGASEGPQRAGIAGAATVAPECRDMATATSQGEGLGAPTPKSEATAAVADDEIVSGAPSPAPIPLGAPRRWLLVVDAEGIAHECAEANEMEQALRDLRDVERTYNEKGRVVPVIEAVADAATVERVARAILDNDREQLGPSDWEWNVVGESVRGSYLSNARAALRALGYEVAG